MSKENYDGGDVRDLFEHDDAPGMPDERLPPGWSRFDPDAGEAGGEEAYLFANGHQVLIGEAGDDGYFVLAYPEHGMTDLCGFVRPLADYYDSGMAPLAGDLNRARDFAHGYMAAVVHYEHSTLNDDLLGE